MPKTAEQGENSRIGNCAYACRLCMPIMRVYAGRDF